MPIIQPGYWLTRIFLPAQPTQAIPNGQERPTLPTWVASKNILFTSSHLFKETVPNNVRKKLEFQCKSSFTFFNKCYLVSRWLALALALQATTSETETLLMPSRKFDYVLFSMFWTTRLHSFLALLIVINCQCMITCRFIVLSIRCGHGSCLIWQWRKTF